MSTATEFSPVTPCSTTPPVPTVTPVTLHQRVRALPADTLTPISLFMSLPREEHAVLLESAAVDGRWGRYSVLACDAALFVHCRQGCLHLTVEDTPLAPVLAPLLPLHGQPFVEGLRELMRALHIEAEPSADLPPITRALYGYLGFGMAGIFNPVLAEVLPATEAEACLMLPRTVLLFDHVYHRLHQASLGEHRELGAPAVSCLADDVFPCASGSLVQTLPDEQEYQARVARVREQLRQGEGIQVVLSARSSMPFVGDCLPLYRRLRVSNASPYMFYQRLPDITLLGASPEVMVRCTGDTLQLSPIAGTRRRGRDEEEDALLATELLQDPKERAEHVMLVDLGRNDVGRVARPGSVRVERSMEVQRFSHVMHLTSQIGAQLRQGLDALDVLTATFPAGTVSGAPKLRAMQIIAETERSPRGPYAGCVGWLGLDKDSVHLDTGIIIRSLWQRQGQLHWQAGAGIVYDSDPAAEAAECRHKAAIMHNICQPAACHTQGECHVLAHR